MTPLQLYGEDLLHVAAGGTATTCLRADDGTAQPLDLRRWNARPDRADLDLLARCDSATLDLGCGPGRLTRALHDQGTRCLGIDVSPEAVALAGRGGVPVRHVSAFDRALDATRWQTVLLADGNIGIGGDPARLLRRCLQLLAPGGAVLAELEGPASPTRTVRGRLESRGRTSSAFAWARVSVLDAAHLARRSGLAVTDTWCRQDRWFVRFEAVQRQPPSAH